MPLCRAVRAPAHSSHPPGIAGEERSSRFLRPCPLLPAFVWGTIKEFTLRTSKSS